MSRHAMRVKVDIDCTTRANYESKSGKLAPIQGNLHSQRGKFVLQVDFYHTSVRDYNVKYSRGFQGVQVTYVNIFLSFIEPLF